ncbi:carbohydrate ABC transporter permease [Kaistia algarum]|uniref:carbohydrate ABC transporter permease n=1 Tax=Kaistia algarum TaxID=2083279 RepID=UPI002258F2DC|nr:sugar ABC transporter permease [Kaistia algarum]MCX5514794.1 sugar ABC transporter permease [Kaistia algarum]
MTAQLNEDRKAAKRAALRALPTERREALAGILFVLPDALGLLVFIGLPMLLAIGMSAFEVDGFGGFRFVGLDNYARMAADPLFWSALRVTLTFALMAVPLLYVIGLMLALLVQKTSRFNTAMRFLFFAPQVVSLVVVALVWQLMSVEKIGVLPRLIASLGLGSVSFLGNPHVALFTVVLAFVWFLMGFYMLIFIGGLQDIPKEYYEAARIDGASRAQSFWHITLPLLRPTSFFVLVVSSVAAVSGQQAFDLVYVMTRGGPANATLLLITYIYQQAFQYGAFGYASAMATLLVLMLMAITLAFFWATRGGRFQYE